MPMNTLIPARRPRRALLLAAVLAFAGAFVPAFAVSLDQVKAQGLVGEQANGYLGIVAGAGTDVQALVADINGKRKQEYRAIAQRNNATIEAVEALAGKTAIERTPPGQYVRLPSGQWRKK